MGKVDSDRFDHLSPYSIAVLRAVDIAGEREWASANAVADVVLGLGRAGAERPWWVFEAASRGKVYGDLVSSVEDKLLETRVGTVRGKSAKLYRLLPRGRRAMLHHLRRLQNYVERAIDESGGNGAVSSAAR